jgi:hypothetical protein
MVPSVSKNKNGSLCKEGSVRVSIIMVLSVNK